MSSEEILAEIERTEKELENVIKVYNNCKNLFDILVKICS